MKILFTNVSEQSQRDFVFQSLGDNTVIVSDSELTSELILANSDIDVLSVFVSSKVTGDMIQNLPKLKLIATRSTGFDHIDLVTCKEKGITVCSVPFYGENTVAEHAMALILSLARKIPQTLARIEDSKFDYNGLRGWDMKGKTIGIIGGGHIGMHLAKMAVGFEMNVVVFDLKPLPEEAEKIGFTYVPLDSLLASADIISLHLPLNPHTEHIMNQDAFQKVKKGVYVINTARGGLIDTTALIEAIKSGIVAGAGLDVLEGEDLLTDEMNLIGDPKYKDQWLTLLQDHILMETDNVIVTPHNAFNSTEALQRILQTTIDNIINYIKQTPQNVVNLP